MNQEQQQRSHLPYQNNFGQHGYAENRQQHSQTQQHQQQNAYSPMYTTPNQYQSPQQHIPLPQSPGFQPQVQYGQYPQYLQDQSSYSQHMYMNTPPIQHNQLPQPAPVPTTQSRPSIPLVSASTHLRHPVTHSSHQMQSNNASPRLQTSSQSAKTQQDVQRQRSSQQTGQVSSSMMQSQARVPSQQQHQQRASMQPSPSLMAKPSPVHQLHQSPAQPSSSGASKSFPQTKVRQSPAQHAPRSISQSTPQLQRQGKTSSFSTTTNQNPLSQTTPAVKKERESIDMSDPRPQLESTHSKAAPQVQSMPKPQAATTINPAALHNTTPTTTSQSRTSASLKTERMSNGTANGAPSPVTGSNKLPIDYQVLMLSLAEEYISEARRNSKIVALNGSAEQAARYYQLIAQGLGCMDTVLTRWQFQDPRTEARLRLRYASLLFEETENDTQAQEILSRGITLCERSRLVDLKNAMNHLLVRIHFKSSPRAALKLIDNLLPDLEVYKQTAWVYAFRFLRASLYLQQASTSESHSALNQLKAVSEQAEKRRHVTISMMSSALEALIYLRNGTTEAIEQAQRALAATRSHQLDPGLEEAPQITAFVNILDLLVDLVLQKTDTAAPKLQAMQNMMDKASKDQHWREDGACHVPIPVQAAETLGEDSNGIMKRTANGQYALVFDWLARSELYALGYVLSGVATIQKDTTDHRAQKFFTEGLKITQDTFESKERSGQSLKTISVHLDTRLSMRYTMQLFFAHALCIKSDWSMARKGLNELIRAADGEPAGIVPRQLLMYVDGTCYQGSGHDQAALQKFQAPELALPTQSGRHSGGSDLDLRILAAMNTCLILQGYPHRHVAAQDLLKRLTPFAETHHNKTIVSAVNLLRANIDSSLPIVQMKAHITTALDAARKSSNHHLLTVIMNMMVVRFFTNTVGEQAEKSAEVGVKLAKKVQSPLWQAVANQNLSTTMELGGNMDRATSAKRAAQGAWEQVPDAIRQKFAHVE
ncbi:hypothetical protein MBLNU457_6971t1 [Dothideomycetes sp. NU457]